MESRLIRDIEAQDRPREKVLAGGIKSLTNSELMALLFATGIKGKSVIELCDDILKDNHNHLSLVTKMTVKDLCRRYKGIGPAKAITLLAALELGIRTVADEKQMDNPVVAGAEVAAEIMRPRFLMLNHEEFWVMYLNRAGHVIKEERISQGGTSSTAVDVKIILKHGIECLASSMLLFHNHPSGALRPSMEDDRLTKKIASAAAMLDIIVHDHIIITDAAYFSYADNGKL